MLITICYTIVIATMEDIFKLIDSFESAIDQSKQNHAVRQVSKVDVTIWKIL